MNEFTFLDCFCGAGGASAGILQSGCADVALAINHDQAAIDAHARNHPGVVHWNDDIRKVYPLQIKEEFPAINAFWWSPDCTHFSIAKGGTSRDPDSRMLADELGRYVQVLKPKLIMVENVKEFLTWGPLNGDGKVVQTQKGAFYFRWVRQVWEMGYEYQFRIINSADLGAYTSRERYFGVFIQKESDLSFSWPIQTHLKKGGVGLLSTPRWRSCREILDIEDRGESILYGRKGRKPFSQATLNRIAYGLSKFGKEGAFIPKYYSSGGNPNQVGSINAPLPTIPTVDRFGLAQVEFIQNRKGNKYNVHSLNVPLCTITTKPDQSLITGLVGAAIDRVQTGARLVSTEEPLPTIKASWNQYLLSWKVLPGSDQPFHLERADTIGPMPPWSRRVGEYWVDLRIKDLWYRMLKVEELARAQGFPAGYHLDPTSKTRSKKFIGNSVEVNTVAELVRGFCGQVVKSKSA